MFHPKDEKMRKDYIGCQDWVPKCAFFLTMVMSLKGSLNQGIAFSKKHLRIFLMGYLGCWKQPLSDHHEEEDK